MMVAPWGKIYKLDSLKEKEIIFLDSNIYEDVYFNMKANYTLSISTTNYNGYFWVYNRSSVSNTIQKKLNPHIDLTSVFTKINESIDRYIIPSEEYEYYEYFFIKSCIWYIIHSGRGVNYQSVKAECTKLFSWLDENFLSILLTNKLDLLNPKGR
jgi:hypothetical protein